MKSVKWEDVLKRNDIIGGDLEAHEGGDIYRGPIKAIRVEGKTVVVNLEWCAKTSAPANPGSGEWRSHPVLAAFISSDIQLQEISDNRLMVNAAGFGTWIIFPKDGSKLDKNKVTGFFKEQSE